MRVAFEQLTDRPAQRAGAVAMNNANLAQAASQ